MIRLSIVLLGMWMMGCQVQPNDTDPGIFYPNPKATLRLSAGDGGDGNTQVNAAVVGQLNTVTLTGCEGAEESLFFGDTLNSELEDSLITLDSQVLKCATKMTLHASDLADQAALVISVTRGANTVRLSCPSETCFPMTFTGLIEFPEPDSDDEPAVPLRWNILRDSSFLMSMSASDDFQAGACEGDTLCEAFENEVTDRAAIESLEDETDFWSAAMSASSE